MTLLDLLCLVHDQQYIKVLLEDTTFPVDGTAAYVLRAYDIGFYMQQVKYIKPIVFNNKITLQVECMTT